MLDSTLPRAKMEFSVLIREPKWPKLFMNIKYYELGFYHKTFKWKRVRELFLPAQSFRLRQAEISEKKWLESMSLKRKEKENSYVSGEWMRTLIDLREGFNAMARWLFTWQTSWEGLKRHGPVVLFMSPWQTSWEGLKCHGPVVCLCRMTCNSYWGRSLFAGYCITRKLRFAGVCTLKYGYSWDIGQDSFQRT